LISVFYFYFIFLLLPYPSVSLSFVCLLVLLPFVHCMSISCRIYCISRIRFGFLLGYFIASQRSFVFALYLLSFDLFLLFWL